MNSLPPLVGGVGEAFIYDGVEAGPLLDKDLGEGAVLAEQNRLEADEFEEGKEHSDESALGLAVAEQLAERERAIFHGEATGEELDHLPDSDRVVLQVEGGALAGALEDVAEDADQVDGVGSDFGFSRRIVFEFADAGVGP